MRNPETIYSDQFHYYFRLYDPVYGLTFVRAKSVALSSSFRVGGDYSGWLHFYSSSSAADKESVYVILFGRWWCLKRNGIAWNKFLP